MNKLFQWLRLIVAIAAVEVLIVLAFMGLINLLLSNNLPAAPFVLSLPLFTVVSAAVLTYVLLPEETS